VSTGRVHPAAGSVPVSNVTDPQSSRLTLSSAFQRS
jgi:hypothetical protein